jgi:CBS domain containing-hemolysin-like protein
MEKRIAVVDADCTVNTLSQVALEYRAVPFYLVQEKGRILGIVTGEAALEELGEKGGEAALGEITNRNFILAAEDTTLFEVLVRMRKAKTAFALVARKTRDIAPGDVMGVITAGQILEAVEGSVEMLA